MDGSDVAEQSSVSNSDFRVLRFRRRGALYARPLPPAPPVEDLSRYENEAEPDDYRHRMIMNLAGLAATVFLVVVGVWLATTMAQMRKNQDCVLSGKRNCVPIQTTISATRNP